LKLIFQYKPKEQRNEMHNQTTSHKTTNKTTSHSNDEITKKKT